MYIKPKRPRLTQTYCNKCGAKLLDFEVIMSNSHCRNCIKNVQQRAAAGSTKTSAQGESLSKADKGYTDKGS